MNKNIFSFIFTEKHFLQSFCDNQNYYQNHIHNVLSEFGAKQSQENSPLLDRAGLWELALSFLGCGCCQFPAAALGACLACLLPPSHCPSFA